MNKQYNLKLDLKFKCHNSKMKFDEFDKNTSDFYINLTKDNEVVDIDNAILTLVALKPDGTTEAQFLEVKDNNIYCNLKASMKDIVGEYSCMAMLTLKDKVVIVEQPISYTINENKLLRALNREAEGTERFTILTDMINRLSDIEINENTRISNETDRLLLQQTLEGLIKEVEKAELDRQEHELLRKKTHQELKEEIKKSETINSNTEATNNVAKELINSVNLTHEEIKKTNKDTKAVLESTREFENEARENEEDRQKLFGNAQITLKELKNSEESRVTNENIRIKNEEARELKVSNYETRYNNLIEITETLKSELSELNSQSETNEANRVDAENLRKQRYNEFETAYNSLISDIQSQLENTNTVKVDLISKVNKAKEDMTLTVQTALDNLTKKVDSKIVEVNNAKNEMTRQANDTVAKANQSIGQVNAMSNKANETNSKVNEALVKTTKCIDDVNKTKDDLVNQFNALAPSDQSNAEVQLARTDIVGKTHSSLQERLVADSKMQNMLFEEVEGSCITSESVPSNIQDVEIYGNTYQDPNTLEIASLGTEIEGTNQVKINISSCNALDKEDVNYEEDNKEIILPCKLDGFENSRDRFYYDGSEWIIEKTIKNIIFNGSEAGWSINTGFTNNDFLCVYVAQADRKPSSFGVCNRFNTLRHSQAITDNIVSKECFRYDSAATYIYINKSRLETEDLNGFKKFLMQLDAEGNPLTIYYQLAEPQTIKTGITDANLLSLKTFEDKTHIHFKDSEVEGAIKCKVPKSLSASVSSNFKSIEGVRQELDNVKNLVDTVGTMEVTNDTGFVSVDDTIDGYVSDVEVRGKSLVNLLKTEWENGLYETYGGKKCLKVTKTNTPTQNIRTIVAGRTYTLIYHYATTELVHGTTNPFGSIHLVLNKDGAWAYDVPVKNFESNKSDFIQSVSVFTIPTDKDFTEMGISGVLRDIDGTVWIPNIMLLEGDHTNNPPSYFEGLMSVGQDKEIEVLSCNQNLFKRDNLANWGSVNIVKDEDNEVIFSTSAWNTGVIFITESKKFALNKEYLVSWEACGTYKGLISNIVFCNLDGSNKQEISKETRFSISSYKNEYIGVFVKNASINVAETTGIKNFRIAVKEDSPYVTHQSNKRTLLKPVVEGDVTTYEQIVLRSINENVYDSIEKHSNKYKLFERCGEVTLDGSEGETWNEYLNQSAQTTTIAFKLTYSNHKSSWNVNNILSDKFNYIDGNSIYNFDVRGICSDGQGIIVRVNKSDLVTQDLAGFKQWLQSNPITAIYELAEPLTTELPYDLNLRTFANQSNFIVNAGAINPSIKFKIKNCLANTVKGLMNKVQKLEDDYIANAIKQNKLALRNTYNSDSLGFDIQVMTNRSVEAEIDYEVYNLIKENIEVGKDNYDREQVETIIDFYVMIFKISFEMGMELFDLIEQQHNPHIEGVIEGECEIVE